MNGIFDSWLDKLIWKWKTKQISKRFERGVKPTQDEWNHLAKPFLRETMQNIRKNCPFNKEK